MSGRLIIISPWQPEQMGNIGGIPATTDYALFHNLNRLAEEVCGKGYNIKLNRISVLESSLWEPCVKAEHLKSLGWSSLEWIASVKDGQTTIRRTTLPSMTKTYPSDIHL